MGKTPSKLSDKRVIDLVKKIGPINAYDIYNKFKISYPYVDKHNILRRLRRLRKKSKIAINKEGKFFFQAPLLDKSKNTYTPADDFINICKKYKYSIGFTKKQLAEADIIKDTNKGLNNRKDFCGDNIITIDGEDAKDLDDAVSVIKTKDKYILSVHIADVSSYVKEDSLLDKEAFKRGNSVYLVDKVVPMLPEVLSNGVCSLNEGVDRLTLSVLITFNFSGDVLDYHFYEGIIKVSRRYTYEEIDKILNCIIEEKDKPFVDMINKMNELAQIIYKKRVREGSLDFNFNDIKITCNSESFPIEVKKVKRLLSHQVIEEFMLSANRVVARFLGERGKAIYRIHESPNIEKLRECNRFIQKLGYFIKDLTNSDPIELQALLKKISGTNHEKIINTILLRSLKQAYYHTENKGHFALSFQDYTHFTSPIRRYSDLIIHRLLKKAIGVKTECKRIANKRYLNTVTQRTSITERTAMEAEREIIKKKSARFMKNMIGKVFDGIISGITPFGMFVELEPYGVEGLIRVVDLDGFYLYDEDNYLLYRKDYKVKYQVGGYVKAILTNVNVEKSFIDLNIVS